MRFELRHNNQMWHVFDTVRYTADMSWHANLKADARYMVDLLNAKEDSTV